MKERMGIMKPTGIVRKVDELGRIVLPIELRRSLEYREGQALELFVEGNDIWLCKHEPHCCFCDNTKKLYTFRGKLVCGECVAQLRGRPTSLQRDKKEGKVVNLGDVKLKKESK